MRKLILFIAILFGLNSFGQISDALTQDTIDLYIVPNMAKSITAAQMNDILTHLNTNKWHTDSLDVTTSGDTIFIDRLGSLDTVIVGDGAKFWGLLGNDTLVNTNDDVLVIDSALQLPRLKTGSKIGSVLVTEGSYHNVYPVSPVNFYQDIRDTTLYAGWSYGTTDVAFSAYGIAYGNGVFVAVGDSIMYSDDGEKWEFAVGNYLSEDTINLQAVAYGEGLFVAVGSHADSNVIISIDGRDWRPVNSLAGEQILDVEYGNGMFVAVGNSDFIATSENGSDWTTRTPPGTGDWNGICYGGGLWVAVSGANTGEQICTSPDGITWTARTTPGGIDRDWCGVAYGNGVFVATATDKENDSTVMTSSDGVTWTLRKGNDQSSWGRVIYAQGKFMACGNTGTTVDNIMSSTDGITWTMHDTYDLLIIQDVTYGNGKYVAVGGYCWQINGSLERYDAASDNNFMGDVDFKNEVRLSGVDSVAVGSVLSITATDSNGDIKRISTNSFVKYTAVATLDLNTYDLDNPKRINLANTSMSDDQAVGNASYHTAGENLTQWDLCYMKSDGKLWKADADASTTMPGLWMATEGTTADDPGWFFDYGYVRNDAWNWTIGGVLYASTTAGELTQTAPSGASDQVQAVGVAVSADIIRFAPDLTLIEIAP